MTDDTQTPNLLDQLAAAREEYASDRDTFIEIPGYDSAGLELLAHYRLLEGPEIEEIANRGKGTKGRRRPQQKMGSWTANLNAALDTMAAACIGIYFQRPEDETPQPLMVNGEPVANYGDPALKVALKIGDDIKTTRGIILATFANKEMSIANHAMKLNMWFQNTNANVDAAFLGED